MLYRSMRARQDLGVQPEEYTKPLCLFDRMPTALIAGDFMQMRPANELSLGDDLQAIADKGGKRQVLAEHFGARDAIMSIDTVIHLKKTNRFQDNDLPQITAVCLSYVNHMSIICARHMPVFCQSCVLHMTMV